MLNLEINLRITEITDFEARSGAAIEQGVLELQISMAYLLQREQEK